MLARSEFLQRPTTTAWLHERVDTANRIFAPAQVSFTANTEAQALSNLQTRADRHALGSLLHGTDIHVFVVPLLRDVDDPTLLRRGVHWRPTGMPRAHFVVIIEDSGPSVLAHELGHYFGNPHSAVVNNIMSYARQDDVMPFFDAQQIAIVRRHAQRSTRQ